MYVNDAHALNLVGYKGRARFQTLIVPPCEQCKHCICTILINDIEQLCIFLCI
jgi:hypothetical protein